MHAIVTARVPAGIKEQGRVALEKIGSTPTELINAAYEYVLAKGELPTAEKAFRSKAHGKQPLTADQREELQARLKKTTFPIPASYWDGKTDTQLLQEALEEKYARADRHECSH